MPDEIDLTLSGVAGGFDDDEYLVYNDTFTLPQTPSSACVYDLIWEDETSYTHPVYGVRTHSHWRAHLEYHPGEAGLYYISAYVQHSQNFEGGMSWSDSVSAQTDGVTIPPDLDCMTYQEDDMPNLYGLPHYEVPPYDAWNLDVSAATMSFAPVAP